MDTPKPPSYRYLCDALAHGDENDVRELMFTSGVDKIPYKPMCGRMTLDQVDRRLKEKYPDMSAKFQEGLRRMLPESTHACLRRTLEHGDMSGHDVYRQLTNGSQHVDNINFDGRKLNMEEAHELIKETGSERHLEAWKAGLRLLRSDETLA